MILVFGGTTEGKQVAELLDFLNEQYFYSTKTGSKISIHGESISGAMDSGQIIDFCKLKNIRLIINAAHPFAVELHTNIFSASAELGITVVRFERTFPDIKPSPDTRIFTSFPDMIGNLQVSSYKSTLVLTGVQTIPYFEKVRKRHHCYFRVLDSVNSINKAREYGITGDYLIPAQPGNKPQQLIELVQKTGAEVILTKESGDSGFFSVKKEVADHLNIPLWVVKRPVLPGFTFIVQSEKDLLKTFYHLRKTILKTGSGLRSGYTTGTCVTAATKACVIALFEKRFPTSVEVVLPGGEKAAFKIFPVTLSDKIAACTVIKDAGDDPDVTHGKEIGCELRITDQPGISFTRGEGIGVVTLPGLQVEVGEPAINPVPRQMIASTIKELSVFYEAENGFEVEPFVPEGEKIAMQTFNSRVGVVGGISIIGTSGKVIPYSNEAFLSTIKSQLSVAKETGLDEIILTSGKRSENILKPDFNHLPDTAFIHYGNLIGETIRHAVEKGIKNIVLGLMTGKAFKLAEGHLDTHSKKSLFNPEFAAQMASGCGYSDTIAVKIGTLTLANAIFTLIPFSPTEPFYIALARRCHNVCLDLIPRNVSFTLFLISDQGEKLKITNP